MPRVAVISDLHIPYHHKHNVNEAIRVIHSLRPTDVVINGDLWDFDGASRHPNEPEGDIGDAFRTAARLCNRLRRGTPRGCAHHFLEGNHDARLAKIAGEVPKYYRGALHWSKQRGCEEFDHWKGRPYTKKRHGILSLGPMRIGHGWRHSPNHNELEAFELCNILGEPYRHQLCVFGHSHAPLQPTQCRRTGRIKVPLWCANTGYLGDPLKAPYTDRFDVTDWTPSVLVVDWKRGRPYDWSAELIEW